MIGGTDVLRALYFAIFAISVPVYVLSFGSMEWLPGELPRDDDGYSKFPFACHAIALEAVGSRPPVR